MNESKTHKYIYINEKNNIIHIMVPIFGGQTIGVDNTCQTMACLRAFCGPKGVMAELLSYKDNLDADLLLLSESDVRFKAKKNRLLQIQNYIDVVPGIIDAIKNQPVNGESNTSLYRLPDMVLSIMKNSKDGSAVLLSPFALDFSIHLREYTFSLKKDRENKCFTDKFKESLKSKITTDYPPLKSSIKDLIEQRAINEFKRVCGENTSVHNDENFEKLKEILQRNINMFTDTNMSIDYDSIGGYKKWIDLVAIDDDINPHAIEVEEWVKTLMNFANIDEKFLSKNEPDAAFLIEHKASSLRNDERSKAVYVNGIFQKIQLLFAHANVYCKLNNISDVDFGQVLEDNEAVTEEIATIVSDAINNSNARDLENKVISIINSHLQNFGIIQALSEQRIASIVNMCIKNYEIISGSAHFDEFYIVDYDREGDLFCHRGCICFDISRIASSNDIKIHYDLDKNSFLEAVLNDSIQMSKEDRLLKGVNKTVESVRPIKIEFDNHSQGNSKFRP